MWCNKFIHSTEHVIESRSTVYLNLLLLKVHYYTNKLDVSLKIMTPFSRIYVDSVINNTTRVEQTGKRRRQFNVRHDWKPSWILRGAIHSRTFHTSRVVPFREWLAFEQSSFSLFNSSHSKGEVSLMEVNKKLKYFLFFSHRPRQYRQLQGSQRRAYYDRYL